MTKFEDNSGMKLAALARKQDYAAVTLEVSLGAIVPEALLNTEDPFLSLSIQNGLAKRDDNAARLYQGLEALSAAKHHNPNMDTTSVASADFFDIYNNLPECLKGTVTMMYEGASTVPVDQDKNRYINLLQHRTRMQIHQLLLDKGCLVNEDARKASFKKAHTDARKDYTFFAKSVLMVKNLLDEAAQQDDMTSGMSL